MRNALCLLLCFVCQAAMASIPDIFSRSINPADLIPVQIYNNRSRGYAIKMNTHADYCGQPVNSGSCSYQENELWYLVGTADSFKMYNHTAGLALALTLVSDNTSSSAILTALATPLPRKQAA